MALVNRPNGLSPVNNVIGGGWTQQGRLYCIPSSDSTYTYAIGDVVVSATGSDANGIPNVAKLPAASQASGVPLGIIVGVRPADPGVSLQGLTLDLATLYVPKTKSRNYYVYVIDDPSVVFEVQFDSTGAAQNDMHKNASLSITNDQSSTLAINAPYSTTVLTAPNTTNTLPIRLLGAVQRPENTFGGAAAATAVPYIRVLGKFNNHEFGVGTGTNFTGV